VAGLAGFAAAIPLGLASGAAAACLTALFAALPAAFIGHARRGAASPALLLGGGLGALVAGLVLLPRLGPTLSAVIAALLLLGGALLMAEGEDEATADDAGRPALAPLAGFLIAACVAAALASLLRPWPFGLMAAGCAALGAGLASLLPLAGRRRGIVGGIAALVFVPWAAGLLPFTVTSLVGSESRPLVAAGWGGLALVAAAFAWGFGPGLLGGLAAGRPRPLATALAGLVVLLSGLVEVSSLATEPAVLLIVAALLAASLVPVVGNRLGRAPELAIATAVALLLLLAPLGERGGFGRAVSVPVDGDGTRSLVARGQGLARGDAERRPDELLAGHAAGLLASERGSVLLVGNQSGGALSALRAQSFEEIEVREFTGDFARAATSLGLDEEPAVSASPSAWPERDGGWNAFVLQADDPSLPAHAPVFTESAYRRAASLLAPGGVFVQRLRVSRLGPEGLIRVIRTAKGAFPNCFVLTADLARDGSLLLLARPQQSGTSGLPWNRFVLDPELNPRLDEAVARSLKEALLFKRGDLLGAFAAGPRELAELQPEVQAFDTWTPGSEALRFPAPEGAAVSLTRALLYARIGTLELPVDLEVQPSLPPWQDRWPFAGLETQLGQGWSPAGGAIRFGNRFRPVLGDFGLYRDVSRKIAFERKEGRIEVVELGRSVAGADTVAASARSFLDEHATRTAEGLINGHRALIVIREPSPEEQHVHATWHCPVQGKLYAADYSLTDGRPGLFEEPLEFLGQSLRCSHGPVRPPR
jgi:hypothetical protein